MEVGGNLTSEELHRLQVDVKALQENLDAFYQLMCGTFISLVQPGFALLEAGAIHSKNAANIVLKNLLDTFVSAASYYLVGYSFAYGDGNWFLGLTYWAGTGLPAGLLPHWYYQFIFANTAATIISGAVAERCNFVAYLTYSISITGVVYPIASSWVWNDKGWLKVWGFDDFSGSGVVHALGGACSFVGAYLIGPRIGAFVNGKKQHRPGHSAPLMGIGVLLIMTGFLAFNGGSERTASRPGDGALIATAMVNTAVSGSGAVITALILGRLGAFGPTLWPYFEIINSTLCGLVSVCAGCDKFETWAAILTGSIAVFIYWFLKYVVIAIKVDDPLDAVATHLGSGFWGLVARPLLARDGVVYRPSSRQAYKLLGINVVGGLALVAWGAGCSLIIFGSLKLMGYLRAAEEDELKGMDVSKHGGYSYPPAAYEMPQSSQYESSRRVSLAISTLTRRNSSKLEQGTFTNIPLENSSDRTRI